MIAGAQLPHMSRASDCQLLKTQPLVTLPSESTKTSGLTLTGVMTVAKCGDVDCSVWACRGSGASLMRQNQPKSICLCGNRCSIGVLDVFQSRSTDVATR